VSYAWNDAAGGPDREADVDRFCAAADARGIHALRDRADMKIGDRISAFMRRLAQSERVVVFLSEKYLRSVYCMTELYEVWRRCADNAAFTARVTTFALPDARIADVFERSEHVAYWKGQHARYAALLTAHGPDYLSVEEYAEFRRIGNIVRHLTEILALVQDTLRPGNIDVLISHVFDDGPPGG
jgi:internalin A